MLAAIASMLSRCTDPEMAVPAAVALQGLKELCCAEVTHTHTHSYSAHGGFDSIFVIAGGGHRVHVEEPGLAAGHRLASARGGGHGGAAGPRTAAERPDRGVPGSSAPPGTLSWEVSPSLRASASS